MGQEKVVNHTKIFFSKSNPTFMLDLDELLAINVLGDEIGILPIIAQAYCGKAIIGQGRRDFVVVVTFLLSGIKFVILYFA